MVPLAERTLPEGESLSPVVVIRKMRLDVLCSVNIVDRRLIAVEVGLQIFNHLF